MRPSGRARPVWVREYGSVAWVMTVMTVRPVLMVRWMWRLMVSELTGLVSASSAGVSGVYSESSVLVPGESASCSGSGGSSPGSVNSTVSSAASSSEAVRIRGSWERSWTLGASASGAGPVSVGASADSPEDGESSSSAENLFLGVEGFVEGGGGGILIGGCFRRGAVESLPAPEGWSSSWADSAGSGPGVSCGVGAAPVSGSVSGPVSGWTGGSVVSLGRRRRLLEVAVSVVVSSMGGFTP